VLKVEQLEKPNFLIAKYSMEDVSVLDKYFRRTPRALVQKGCIELETAFKMEPQTSQRAISLESAARLFFDAAEKAESKGPADIRSDARTLLAYSLVKLGKELAEIRGEDMRLYANARRSSNSDFEGDVFGVKHMARYALIPLSSPVGAPSFAVIREPIPDKELDRFVRGRAERCLEYAKKIREEKA